MAKTLFLADAKFEQFSDNVTVPVISGWDWHIAGDGTGCLTAPDGTEYCKFDLSASILQFEPDGEITEAPGLTAGLVQDMGEKYAVKALFSEEEQKVYTDHVKRLDADKKAHNKEVRESLRGVIQMEYKPDGTWLAHVDTDKVKELTGIETTHVLSKEQGIELFNNMSESMGATPLRDPMGYMPLKGNVYEFIHKEYEYQYEDKLQAIENDFAMGTGYGLNHVLDNLQSVVRKNVTQYGLIDGQMYGNLRFMPMNNDRKKAIQEFVTNRVNMTVIHEKKRSYEASAITEATDMYEASGLKLKEALFPSTNSKNMQI